MNDSEKELRAAAIEARDYHPNCAFEIIGELDRLRSRIAELEGARDTFDRAAFLTEIHAKSFRNGPTSPHFVDVADVYRALEHHAVSAPAVAQAAEFHAIGNPPPEVMALVQEEYKRMAEAKDRTSAQPSGEGAGR